MLQLHLTLHIYHIAKRKTLQQLLMFLCFIDVVLFLPRLMNSLIYRFLEQYAWQFPSQQQMVASGNVYLFSLLCPQTTKQSETLSNYLDIANPICWWVTLGTVRHPSAMGQTTSSLRLPRQCINMWRVQDVQQVNGSNASTWGVLCHIRLGWGTGGLTIWVY
jgi:hypothetical protein